MVEKIYIRTYLINSISEKFKKRLRRLSFGRSGFMEALVDSFTKDDMKVKGYAVCAYSNSKLIGWSLFSPHKIHDYLGISNSKKYCSINIFVDENYRNMGVGKKIMLHSVDKINKNFPSKKIAVYPHDFYSNKLFDSVSNKVSVSIKKF